MRTRPSEKTENSVRTARAAAGVQIYRETVDLVTDLARNPIVELIIAIVLIERLQQMGILSNVLGTTMEVGIGGIITAQQVAPLLPYIAQGGKDIMAGLAALAPAIAAGA